MSEPLETLVDLLRHGEPEGGSTIIRGRTDHPLTTLGWQQMHKAVSGTALWDRIISSPAQRCYQFAEKMSSSLQLPIECNEKLWEINLGDWEGKSFTEIQTTDAERLQDYWQDPVNVTPPGAESLPDFQSRILQAWQDILEQSRGQHVLMIAHSGTIRMILGHILQTPLSALLRLELPYAGISRVRIYDAPKQPTQSSVVFHNGHLSCSKHS